MKGYLVTQEQIEKIEHYKRMIEVNAELIKDLCNVEKDDIVYGFELGKLYSHLRQCFMDMTEFENQIRSQPFDTKYK